MVSPVEYAENGETVQRFPDGMKAMNLDSRSFHFAEECPRGRLAADGVVQDTDIEAPAGALLKGLRHRGAGDVVQKDIALHPNALLSGLDVADQRRNHGHRFDENRQFMTGDSHPQVRGDVAWRSWLHRRGLQCVRLHSEIIRRSPL